VLSSFFHVNAKLRNFPEVHFCHTKLRVFIMFLRHKHKREGYTLVELLLVLSLAGVLVSMSFPALQAALGAVRKFQCASHFKEIGKGFQSYHAANPSKSTSFFGEEQIEFEDDESEISNLPLADNAGWIGAILPFVEDGRAAFVCPSNEEEFLGHARSNSSGSSNPSGSCNSSGSCSRSSYSSLAETIMNDNGVLVPLDPELTWRVKEFPGSYKGNPRERNPDFNSKDHDLVIGVADRTEYRHDDYNEALYGFREDKNFMYIDVFKGTSGTVKVYTSNGKLLKDMRSSKRADFHNRPIVSGMITAKFPKKGNGNGNGNGNQYGHGKALSYGINEGGNLLAENETEKILAIEYNSVVAKVLGKNPTQQYSERVQPRHSGVLNALYRDGSVKSQTPTSIDPTVAGRQTRFWRPKSWQEPTYPQ